MTLCKTNGADRRRDPRSIPDRGWIDTMRKTALTLSLLAALPIAAHGQTPPSSLSVENAWARATATSAKTGAVYMTIVGHGAPDRLVAVAAPTAGEAELHQTIRDGNVMKMRPVDGLPISAGRPITLAPGGYHVMLMDLKQPLREGQSFPLTLTFQKAGTVQTTVTVKGAGAGGSMQVGGPGHDMDMPMPMNGQSKP